MNNARISIDAEDDGYQVTVTIPVVGTFIGRGTLLSEAMADLADKLSMEGV